VLSQKTPEGVIASSIDPSLFGNIEVIYTTNLTLKVTVNFDTKKMYGCVDLTMKAKQDASEVILDYQGLDLVSAHYMSEGSTSWTDAFYDTYTSPFFGRSCASALQTRRQLEAPSSSACTSALMTMRWRLTG
jgi:hypothetical protein